MHATRPLGLLVAGALLGAGLTASAATEPHDLMPAPAALDWQVGDLPIDGTFHFSASGPKDLRITKAVARLGVFLQREAGLPKTPPLGGAGRGALVLEWLSVGLPVQALGEDESYRLTVDARGARLAAANPLGILRGVETFRQLVRVDQGRTFVPAVSIDDRPRFPWRGLLIDPARHFLPVDVVERTLDGMAAVKLNVLHWHLCDDQGFRLESQKFPALQEKGSGGSYYTNAQVQQIVEYARDRGIRVVPELDMPGHATSWLAGLPELGSAPGPYDVARTWGILDNTFDPTAEHVYSFLDAFLERIALLFPDAYVHLGGDEVTPKRWNESAKIQEFAYQHGLRDHRDLQAHFARRASEILGRHGKKMMGWDDILHPELPKTVLVQSWRGVASLVTAAGQGYDAVLSSGYYLDHMKRAGDHYVVDPLPADSGLGEGQRLHVLGGEACLWGEFVDAQNIDSRLWPRTAAIAERLWSPADVVDVGDLYRRLERQSARLDSLGLTHASSYVSRLQGLAGGQPVAPLRVLADVLEPVGHGGRLAARAYTSATPLDRLVDIVPPESDTARQFRGAVDLWLGAGGDMGPLRRRLASWVDNHSVLEPAVAQVADSSPIRSLSKDLAAVAVVGNLALDALAEGVLRSPRWPETAREQLAAAAKPRAELRLAIVPAVLKLVLAAGSLDKARSMPRAEWNAWLDKELAALQAPAKGQ